MCVRWGCAPDTTTTADAANAARIQQLEQEVQQVKIGLGAGLGSGIATTILLAVGATIYYRSQ